MRDELFATIEQAELSLEQFIGERSNGHLLQQAVEGLQQIRGTLKLIELTGAEMLAQEMLDQANDIPAGAGNERDDQLSALSSALYVLRRYLESVDANRQEIPELLLPTINELRRAGGQALLPESFFFSARRQPRPPRAQTASDDVHADGRRLRHMYQVGLLGYIREQNAVASLRLMGRAMERLDSLLGEQTAARLCWIAAGAIEAIIDGQLLPRRSRKQLFSRLDRELKNLLGNPGYEPPLPMLKELLYLVALADSKGNAASNCASS